jgi:hypothetical protein
MLDGRAVSGVLQDDIRNLDVDVEEQPLHRLVEQERW